MSTSHVMTKLKKIRACAFLALAAALPLSVATVQASSLDQIKDKGVIVVGSEAAYEPFDYMEDGKIVGYNIDIMHEIARRTNLQIEHVNLPFNGLFPALIANKMDLVIAALTITPERVTRYAFTRRTSDTTHVLMVRANEENINTLEDLDGKIVAGQLASSFEKELRELDARLKADNKKGLRELKLYQSFPEMQVALANRQVDAVAISTPMAAVIMKKRPNLFKLSAALGDKQYLAWATRAEDTALRDYINEQIAVLEADGTLKTRQDKWFGFDVQTPASGYLPEGAL